MTFISNKWIKMIRIVYGRDRYRDLLAGLVDEGDTVIEIGPHLGVSTRAVALRAKKVFAIDKSEQAERAAKTFPDNVEFVKGDARFFETVNRVLRLTKSCDVLAVDMGGGRFPDTVFKVWAVWSGVFQPRESVIRNRGLGEFLKRAKIDDPSLVEYLEKGPAWTEKAKAKKKGVDGPNEKEKGWLSQCGRKSPRQLQEGMEELKNWML